LGEENAEAVVETMEFGEEAVLEELESVILGYLEGSDNLRACGNKIKLGLTEIIYVSARIREDTSVQRLKEGPYWEMELDPKYNCEADFLVEVL
jgi:hypothetical protein